MDVRFSIGARTLSADPVIFANAIDQSPCMALDLAIDQAVVVVARRLRDVLTTTRFGIVTVEVRNGYVFIGGGATVRISAQGRDGP